MKSANASRLISPGARVRCDDGFIGVVERLDTAETGSNGAPDRLIVRSEDGQWWYDVPLSLVQGVEGRGGAAHKETHPVVTLALHAQDLPSYVVGGAEPSSGPEQSEATAPASIAAEQTDIRVPVATEELTADKMPIVRGHVHIHKGIQTEEQHLSVPVYHEEIVVEHIPPERYDASSPPNPDEVMIPLVEERLVVQKQAVIKEYLRVRRQRVEEQRDISDTVRHEVAEITEERSIDDGAPLLRQRDSTSDTPTVSPS